MVNSNDVIKPGITKTGNGTPNASRLSTHSLGQERAYLIVLAITTVLLASICPLLVDSSYKESSGLHATVEMAGALFGIVAGFVLIVRFYTLGNRFHLFVGLAFFVNGAEDLVHGLLAFHHVQALTGLPKSSLDQFIPGTYVTGRLLIGIIVFLAPLLSRWLGESQDSKRETKWTSLVVIAASIIATALAFRIPLPWFIYPDHLISRPVDFLSAIVLFLALLANLFEYHRTRDMLTWWLLLSIAVNTVGQFIMSFSKSLYDPFFDVAHVYKILGYAIPLLGFSLYQSIIIGERIRAEKSLQESEMRYRDLFNGVPMGLYRTTPDGRVLDANAAMIEMLGYPDLESLLTVNAANSYVDAQDRERWQAILEREGIVRDFEIQMRRRDGTIIWIKDHTRTVRDSGDESLYYEGSLEEITERKQAEEVLRNERDRAQLYLDLAGVMFVAINTQSKVTLVNKKGGEVLGYEEEEIVGKNWFDHFVPERLRGIVKSISEKLLAGEIEPAEYFENPVLKKRRKERLIAWNNTILRDENGTVIGHLSSGEDITKRKRTEEALKEYSERLAEMVEERTNELRQVNERLTLRSLELQAKNQELETFTYSVSHDLKAPLRGIDGYSRLLLEDYADRLDEEGRFFLHTIRQATTQMHQLIDDLLAYSRLERHTLTIGHVNPRTLVEALVAERADDLNQRGVRLAIEVACESVTADAQSLTQTLRNLLDNALKFTRDVPEPQIEIGGRETENKCILWVRDNGIGFDMQYHDRIFELFQRLHRAEDYAGTGIGLAIARKAMQRIGGRIWAESAPGAGATFYLEIPG